MVAYRQNATLMLHYAVACAHVNAGAGRANTSGGSICYWARLSSLNTLDIIDNSLLSRPQAVEIRSGDEAFEINGDCTFGPA